MLDDPLERALLEEWLEVVRMVTEHSDKFRGEIMRVHDQWMTIVEPEFRNQGLREMDSILLELHDLIQTELPPGPPATAPGPSLPR